METQAVPVVVTQPSQEPSILEGVAATALMVAVIGFVAPIAFHAGEKVAKSVDNLFKD